jgi:hypothetical protein
MELSSPRGKGKAKEELSEGKRKRGEIHIKKN